MGTDFANVLRQYWSTIREKDATAGEFLLALSLIVFCQMSWVPGFFHDGYLYAAFSKNAAEKGFWLIPHLAEDTYSTFYQHSPFVFILGGTFFKIFGSSVTAARLFGSLWAVAMVMMLNWSLRRLQDRWLGFLSGLLLILSYPLVKKARFPNLDLPLCFFMLGSLIFYLKAFVQRRGRFWAGAGIFFGLALLTKGPPALALPLTYLVHLALTKKLKWLLGPWPWIGMVLGLVLFSLWPLSLYINGEIEIFYKYLTNMFVHTATEGRGTVENDPFAYLKVIGLETAPWFLAAIWGTYLAWKRKAQDILLWSCFFLCFLIPFSFMKFKYSHYILPLYAPQAVLAAYAIRDFYRKNYSYIFGVLRPLAYVGALVLLIFPLTVQSRRDQEVLQTLEMVEKMPNSPNAWAIVNGSYSFFGLANLLGYHTYDNAYSMSLNGLEAFLDGDPLEDHVHHLQPINLGQKRWVFLINKSDWNQMEQSLKNRWLEKCWHFMTWEKLGVLVFLNKDHYPVTLPDTPTFIIQ